jgi:cytochrome c biogenesis protein CcdA
MNIWLTLRTFSALFLVTLGFGLVFGNSEQLRVMLGALLAAFGLTFMLRVALVLRQK